MKYSPEPKKGSPGGGGGEPPPLQREIQYSHGFRSLIFSLAMAVAFVTFFLLYNFFDPFSDFSKEKELNKLLELHADLAAAVDNIRQDEAIIDANTSQAWTSLLFRAESDLKAVNCDSIKSALVISALAQMRNVSIEAENIAQKKKPVFEKTFKSLKNKIIKNYSLVEKAQIIPFFKNQLGNGASGWLNVTLLGLLAGLVIAVVFNFLLVQRQILIGEDARIE